MVLIMSTKVIPFAHFNTRMTPERLQRWVDIAESEGRAVRDMLIEAVEVYVRSKKIKEVREAVVES